MELRIKDHKGLGWALRQLRHRLVPGGLILCYHRVATMSTDPHSLCVTPQCFAQQAEWLSRYARPMRLSQLVSALGRGDVPRRAVVITFDDGYADTLYQAKPLLERYDLPATVFVTPGYLDRKREMWSDELERLFLQPGTLPGRLSLMIAGNRYEWELQKAARYTEDDFQRHRLWTIDSDHDPGRRQHLFRSLHKLLLPLPDEDRRGVFDELLTWSGAQPVVRPTHRLLSQDELVRLAEGDLIEVGAHSMSHPVLPKLPVAQQRDEIRQSRATLEHILGRPITSFAYPYGARSHETVALVQDAGYECACISFNDVAFPNTDPFQLPRRHIGNVHGDTVEHQLGLHK